MQHYSFRPLETTLNFAVTRPVFAVLNCIAATRQLLETWRQRHRSSMQLARVETRTLRDIGISESRRFIEINKPFWVK